MAKKADGNTTTAWIRYSQAKALAGEYLGDPEFAEALLRKELAAEVPWQCVRFETPQRYSGPGPGDRKFWCEPDSLTTNGGGVLIAMLEWLVIKGDSAKHINGAVAGGIDLDRGALVRRKLLPPDDVAIAPPRHPQAEALSSKSLIEAEVERRVAAGERYDTITALSQSLWKWMETASERPLKPRSIENLLRETDLWPLPPKK